MAAITAGRETGAKSSLTVRLRRPLLAQALLLMSLLGALGFFDYDQIVALKPLSLFSFAALFAWLAISTRLDSRWVVRVFLPALGLLVFVILYAYVFTLRVDDAPLLPSILSQRNYVYLLLGPVVYLLYLRGWRLADFQRIFLLAMLIVVGSLAVYDVTVSSQSLLLSGSFFVLNLGESADQSAIYRTINTGALFLALYFGRRLFQSRDVFFLLFALAVVALSGVILAISLPRGLLTSIFGALVLYAAFLTRPQRLKLSTLVLPLCLVAIIVLLPTLIDAFVEQFGRDRTYLARTITAETARESIREYPLLGFGFDSAQAVSFQDLFGQFYPSDIGLLGVAFQFGLLGLALYVFLAVWLCLGLLRLLWAHTPARDGIASPKQRAFLWALFVVCLSFLVASPLQARLLYGTGLPLGAFAWGLIMAHRHGLSVMSMMSARRGESRDAAPIPARKRASR